MISSTNHWKKYLKEDAIRSSYELGWMFGYLNEAAGRYRERINSLFFPDEAVTFKEELSKLLRSKLKATDRVEAHSPEFRNLSRELYKLLLCSFASNRTPEEICTGLKDDAEMRAEVIELLIKKSKCKVSRDRKRSFLNRILSGDQNFRTLLIKQKEKEGFPYQI